MGPVSGCIWGAGAAPPSLFVVMSRPPGRLLGFEQRIETVSCLQLEQLIASAYMSVADKNLRHGATTAASHHLGARLRARVHVDLLEIHVLLPQQPPRPLAIGAPAGGIH